LKRESSLSVPLREGSSSTKKRAKSGNFGGKERGIFEKKGPKKRASLKEKSRLFIKKGAIRAEEEKADGGDNRKPFL